MSQICPVFRLTLQPANDYLALCGLVIRQPTPNIKVTTGLTGLTHTHTPATTASCICSLWSILQICAFGFFWAAICVSACCHAVMTLHNVEPASVYSADSPSATFKWPTCCEFNLTKCRGVFPPGETVGTQGLCCAALCNVLCIVTLKGCQLASLPLVAGILLEPQVARHVSRDYAKWPEVGTVHSHKRAAAIYREIYEITKTLTLLRLLGLSKFLFQLLFKVVVQKLN